jgi:two-component system, chemotaxis family, chemotaxis protein CheY
MDEVEPATILIVDDDPFIIDIHKIVACLSAEDALKKLRTGLVPDIIVTDLIMPVIDGFDFVRTLREEHIADSTPIIVLSNQDDYTDFEKTKSLNVTAHYIKIHSTPAETVGLIEGVLQHVRHTDKYPKVPQQW